MNRSPIMGNTAQKQRKGGKLEPAWLGTYVIIVRQPHNSDYRPMGSILFRNPRAFSSVLTVLRLLNLVDPLDSA